jgi:hypothetical protein
MFVSSKFYYILAVATSQIFFWNHSNLYIID